MYCPGCGTQNLNEHRYCRSCGIELQEVSALISGRPVAQPSPPQPDGCDAPFRWRRFSRRGWPIWLIVLIVASSARRGVPFHNLGGSAELWLFVAAFLCGLGLLKILGGRNGLSGILWPMKRIKASPTVFGNPNHRPERSAEKESARPVTDPNTNPNLQAPFPSFVPSVTESTTRLMDGTGLPIDPGPPFIQSS